MDNVSNHSKWIEITVHIDLIAIDALSSFLFDLGCTGIITEETPTPQIKAYIPFKINLGELKAGINLYLINLHKIFPDIPPPSIETSIIENQDWDKNWRKFFKPEQVSEKLMILPEWEDIPTGFYEYVIRIDPGPAFGTGKHATTKMCLQALEKYSPSKSWTMLDVGTGSGILAIYASLLGAEKILGIDIDSEAIRWAERNIALNGIGDTIELSIRPVHEFNKTFSIITANLILNTIIDLLPFFHRLGTKESLFILSGVLCDQIHELEKQLGPAGFCIHKELHLDEWACIIAKKE